MVNKTFSEWLFNELKSRSMSQADLARSTGITRGGISNLINQVRNPDPNTCKAIATAFNLPAETVLQAAGILAPANEEDQLTAEAEHLLSLLSPDRREEAIRFIRYLATTQEGSTSELVTPRMAKPKPSQS